MKTPTLKTLVTDLMAIDLGTTRTVIAVKGNGIVLDEPSCIAVGRLNSEIVAYGKEANDMHGREGHGIKVLTPIKAGVVTDMERANRMLAHFVRNARSGGLHFSTHAVVSMVSDITQVEQRALLNAAKNANIRKVYVMDAGLAAALGAGVSPKDGRASAIVDFGGGITNIAIVAKGAIIHSRSQRIGSEEINAALLDYVRLRRGLCVGPETTGTLKTELASIYPPDTISKTMRIRGLNVSTGDPGDIEVAAYEIYPVVENIIGRVARFIESTLTEVPPEVSADIFDRGITLTGGGAELKGIDHFIRTRTNLTTLISEQPSYATVRGLLKMFDEPELLRKASTSAFRLSTNARLPFEA